VEVVLALQRLWTLLDGLAGKRPDRLAELARAPDAVALPERNRPWEPGGWGDDHAIAADLLDAPGGRTEQEGLARTGLVDHLLVELTDAPAVGQSHRVETAIGNRAGVGDGELPSAGTWPDCPLDAIPDDPRPQL